MKLPGKSTTIPLLGLFLCIFGVKLLVILHHGNPTPYWDQWDAEAAHLYQPWEEGTLSWPQLVAGHNEHRILWTRLMGLLELHLNGGIWDPMFQMVVNAGLHSLAISILLAFLLRELPRRATLPIVFFSAVLAIPVGWENTLAGFQSQFYLLILFGALSLGLLIASRPLGPAWWLGFLAMAAACFTTASGALAGLAVAACPGGQMLAGRRVERRKIIALVLVLACFLTAWAFTPVVPEHIPLKADGLRDWALALAKSLAFPFQHRPSLALLVQLPLLALIGSLVFSARAAPPEKPIPWFLICAALWVWANAAATAYGRGAGGAGPASRYLDTLALGNVLNFAAIIYLTSRWRRRVAAGLLWCWTAILIVGWLGLFGNRVLLAVRNESQLRQVQEANVFQFLADSNRERLRLLSYYSLPYPTADRLADLLENKTVRNFLPTSLRSPLAGQVEDNRGFSANGVPPVIPIDRLDRVWGSSGILGATGTGRLALAFDKPARGHFLKIPVAGQLRGEGMVFSVEDMRGRQIAQFSPAIVLGTHWHPLYVRNPGGPFRLIAEDHRTDRWFAFAEPRELGVFTLLSKAAMHAWAIFVGAGLGLLSLSLFRSTKTPNEMWQP